MVKILSIFILIFSIISICIGSYSIPKTNDMANSMDVACSVLEELKSVEFNAGEWKVHWIVHHIRLILFGILGVISSLGMIKKIEWARKFFLTLISFEMFISIILYLSGLAKYTWEIISPLDLFIEAIVVILIWFILCRKSVLLEFKKET